MIEPKLSATVEPLEDAFTEIITAAWQRQRESDYAYRGFHRCICGAMSDNKDHYIDGLKTNSLCVHYIAHHRGEIPPEEFVKIYTLVQEKK